MVQELVTTTMVTRNQGFRAVRHSVWQFFRPDLVVAHMSVAREFVSGHLPSVLFASCCPKLTKKRPPVLTRFLASS